MHSITSSHRYCELDSATTRRIRVPDETAPEIESPIIESYLNGKSNSTQTPSLLFRNNCIFRLILSLSYHHLVHMILGPSIVYLLDPRRDIDTVHLPPASIRYQSNWYHHQHYLSTTLELRAPLRRRLGTPFIIRSLARDTSPILHSNKVNDGTKQSCCLLLVILFRDIG